MALQKFGVSQKIKTVAGNDKEFEALKEKIVSTNNLVRCAKCGKLLAKCSDDMISVKRKDVDFLAKVSNVKIKCPVCGTCNETLHE
jgi:phage FluMu protein Com